MVTARTIWIGIRDGDGERRCRVAKNLGYTFCQVEVREDVWRVIPWDDMPKAAQRFKPPPAAVMPGARSSTVGETRMIDQIRIACGCKTAREPCAIEASGYNPTIEHCPLHDAAGDLLAACKETLNDGTTMRRTRLICEAAVAKAEPGKKISLDAPAPPATMPPAMARHLNPNEIPTGPRP